MQPSGYPGGPLPGLSDFFSVELLNPQTGHALPSIDYDGSRVFVGEPGQEFTVAVSMSNYTGSDYKISLRVDGNDPGYSLVYYGTNRAYKSVFQGWLHQSGAVSGPCSTTYRLFRLNACKPSQAAATADSVDELAAGRVEVLIDQVVNTGRCQQSLNVKPAGPSSAAADKKLPEGKKWFLAPGLKAEAGSVKAASTSWNTSIFDKVGSLPSLHVRYDSSEALYLRKALNPRFGPHRAILRRSVNPAIATLGTDPVTDTGAPDEATSKPIIGAAAAAGGRRTHSRAAAAAAAAAGGGGVKQEAVGVKREREDGQGEEEYVPRSATAADRVDLTEEPVRPMTVNGRQLAPDELAVCDLCDSDDEGAGAAAAPRWQVKKKQQVEVTEM